MLQANIILFWLIAGVLFCSIEMFFISGIGFLFAGLGALTVGSLMVLNKIAVSSIDIQFIVFFFSSVAWGISLWFPLKKLLKRQTNSPYASITGETAIVIQAIDGDKIGQVRWSGTIMNARLSDPSKFLNRLEPDTQVTIIGTEGNILLVEPK
jgi:membrane protein implicated in regulation of membrane protease activity